MAKTKKLQKSKKLEATKPLRYQGPPSGPTK